MDSSSLQSSSCQTTRRSEDKPEERRGAVEEDGRMGAQTKKEAAGSTASKQKCSKEVYFSILPDRYEPLIEEVEQDIEESAEEKRKRKEEKKRKKKQRYKKYRKNVGKALRFCWRCLVVGLQNTASPYATPVYAMSTVATGVFQTNGNVA
ncbi:uncharacterized protein C1orf115-like [Takifugu rubripes]|uniref:Uncharacterized protein n=1 Tax=Takifugu bimaculatus TaxID=433685 RepID=A0A4Z2BR69_9TELE|nr:uncharacterized protein C1orf115 homolog [Takifugu rubripes]TNM94086.1 hypothetical protein fugu_002262 [Takifugu bimaculatus]|eukprot:XP_011604628.1 PREDICTED: uncharacterized protein C1orf115 homolog [Takifugu rubripes]